MIAQSLSDLVYSYLFPDQLIPLACKNNLAAIDARITEIESLASGKHFDGSKRAASRLLTEQVVQLRESCDPPMNWKEIARRLGGRMTTDAARNRYFDYKAAQKAAAMQKEGYAALSGQAIQEGRYTTPPEVQEKIDRCNHIVEPDEMVATHREIRQVQEIETDISSAAQPALPDAKPPQVEEATVRNSQIVQEIEDVRKIKLSDLEGGKGPLSQAQKEQILELHAVGKSYGEIKQAMGIDGRRIVGVIRGQEQREHMAAAYPKQPEAPQEPSLPGAEGAQKEARANPRGNPEENQTASTTPRPDPKLDYEVADAKIINMKRRGMLNHEIAQVLERNTGGSWDVQKVDARYTELKRQGLA